MKKNGYTVAEVLIVLTIIGILSVLMLTFVRPNEKYVKYAYTNTYTNLNRAVYNIKQDVNAILADEDSTAPLEDRIFPQNKKELCKKLAVNGDSKYGYMNTQVNNCDSFSPITTTSNDEDFNEGAVAFKTTNAMKYYISELNASSSLKLSYFIVWVDLNGDKKPNSIVWKKGKAADIVPYIITSNGDVVPVGYPTVDKRYMSSRVEIANNIETTYTQSMTFYEAQKVAYNSIAYPNIDNMSINFSNSIGGNLAIASTAIPPSPASNSKCTSSNIFMPCAVVINEFVKDRNSD